MAFVVPNYADYYNSANTRLNDYYTRILAEEQGDIERAKRRIDEDYARGSRITSEDYTRNYAFGRESADAQKRELDTDVLSDQKKYESSMAQQQMESESENLSLEGNLLKRGVSVGGLAASEQGKLGQRQQIRRQGITDEYTTQQERQRLRREAIDRALRKSEDDLKYGKERGLEEETIKQRRGTEDLATQWAKFMIEKNQERQEKAQQLGESEYQREFAKRSTEEGFRLQNESLSRSA